MNKKFGLFRFLASMAAAAFCCLVACHLATAQNVPSVPNELNVSVDPARSMFQLDDSFTVNVNAICKSQSGAVWVATSVGLHLYDGAFKRIPGPGSRLQLPDSYLSAVHEDSSGRVWVGSCERITMIDLVRGVVSTVELPEGFGCVEAIVVRGDEEAFVGNQLDQIIQVRMTDGKLVVASATRLPEHAVNMDTDLPAQTDDPITRRVTRLRDMVLDTSGTIWIASSIGVFRIPVDEIIPERAFSDVIKRGPNDAFVDAQGDVWFGGEELHRLARGAKVLTTLPSIKESDDWIRCVLRDPEGNVWLAKKSHIFVMNSDFEIVDRFDCRADGLTTGTRKGEVLITPRNSTGMTAIRSSPCQTVDFGFTDYEFFLHTATYWDGHSLLLPSTYRLLSITPGGLVQVEHDFGQSTIVEKTFRDKDGTIVAMEMNKCWMISAKGDATELQYPLHAFDNTEAPYIAITPCSRGYLLQRNSDLLLLDRNSLLLTKADASQDSFLMYGGAPSVLVNSEQLLSSVADRDDNHMRIDSAGMGAIKNCVSDENSHIVYTRNGMYRVDRITGASTQWPPNENWSRGYDCTVPIDDGRWLVFGQLKTEFSVYHENTGNVVELPTTQHTGLDTYVAGGPGGVFTLSTQRAAIWNFGEASRTVEPPRLSLLQTRNSLMAVADSDGTYSITRPYNRNSATLRWVATADTGGTPEFSIKVPGNSQWIDRRKGEDLNFYALEPGTHEILVRQRNSSGALSEPSRAVITILQPWYKTTLFYTISLFTVGILASAYLYKQRRQVNILQNEVRLRAIAESRLVESQDRLVQRERLAALGEMAAGVGHDINNLLSPILIYGEILAGDSDQTEKIQEIGRVMARQASDAGRIIQRLSPIYRQVGADKSQVEMCNLISECIYDAEARCQQEYQDKEISFNVDVDPLQVTASASDLREVIANVLNNAVDAIEDRGEVTVSNGVENGVVWVEVKDDGPGMTEDVRDRCFDALYTQGKRQGTGIGLAIARSIIGGYDGRLLVSSTFGEGATFRIELPSIPWENNDDLSRRPLPEQLRVLVIDDIESTQVAMKTMLEDLKQNVTCFGDTAAAREELAKHKFDLVISDHGLPGETGFSFCRWLRRESPSLPIVLASGFEEPGMREVCDEFLLKPISRREMERVLQRVLAQSS